MCGMLLLWEGDGKGRNEEGEGNESNMKVGMQEGGSDSNGV